MASRPNAPVQAGDTFWLVACSSVNEGREEVYSILQSRVKKNSLVSDTAIFDVPLNLRFGSFDELIQMADDLTKHDSTCEQILRRLERQILDLDASSELRIIFQRNTLTMDQFLHRFTWDEAKYPKTRYMKDITDLLMTSVGRLDEDVRIRAAAYNDVKQNSTSISKKEGTLIQKDLIDVLSPDIVKENDFIETEHMTTVVVVVPAGFNDKWMATYESLDAFVVPRSTRAFEVTDKEKNSLWKVTLFKKSLENFRTAAKAKKFTVREFKYNPEALQAKIAERSRLETEKNKQESFMTRVCMASFSDVFISWMHIKTMRVFVEAVLRFGVPPKFAAFLLKPHLSKEKKLRSELEDIFATKGMFGQAFSQKTKASDTTTASGVDIDEEYFPYVSLSLVPFQIFVQK